jgi:hypothetical protein
VLPLFHVFGMSSAMNLGVQRGHPHVQMWQAAGTEHTRSLYTRPGDWERTVTAFLARSLPADR